MADEVFENPKLAAIYDPLDPDRSDLDHYVAIAKEFEAIKVLDVGCGTGSFALLLAQEGLQVTGVDPALASLEVAAHKPLADRVTWVHGYASDVTARQFDLATMTGNVAQAIVEIEAWNSTLSSIANALRDGGVLAFESRDPAKRAWERWNHDESFSVTEIEGVGRVDSWVEVLAVEIPLVTFRWTWIFENGETITSESTLRFRERDELAADLERFGFAVKDVREAPDRPGMEFVFIAQT